MWQQIEANKRKSAILVIFMALLLCIIGYAGAFVWFGNDYGWYLFCFFDLVNNVFGVLF